ncbi:ABC transporter permease [Bacillus weihaiensis]|uniref:ABC transporter permease n=1 Tax=Bacillus weihaiensis TaxID=1547283 RepID=UPI00235347C1|nr:ABC transporter permease [Bacillus weihaiensis]
MWPLAHIETLKQIKDRSLLFWTILLPIGSIILLIELFTADSSQKTLVASQSVTGMSVFFSTFVIISIVISFVKDREKGIVARLASTPLKTYNFFLGKSIPFFVIIVLQILLLTILGVYLYDIEITHYGAYFFVIILLSMLVTSWGLAISVFAKTENTGLVMTNIIALGTAVACGLWTPFDKLPAYLQTIGMIFPQYWAHQGLVNSVSTLPGGENLTLVTLVLLGYTLLGFIISLIGYKNYIKMAKS